MIANHLEATIKRGGPVQRAAPSFNSHH